MDVNNLFYVIEVAHNKLQIYDKVLGKRQTFKVDHKRIIGNALWEGYSISDILSKWVVRSQVSSKTSEYANANQKR